MRHLLGVLDQRVERAVDRRGKAQRFTFTHDVAIEIIDLGRAAVGKVLRSR